MAVSADHRVKLKESEMKDKHLDIARELKKAMEQENDGDTNFDWRTRYSHQRIGKGSGRLGNKWTNGDHSKDTIVGFWFLIAYHPSCVI